MINKLFPIIFLLGLTYSGSEIANATTIIAPPCNPCQPAPEPIVRPIYG